MLNHAASTGGFVSAGAAGKGKWELRAAPAVAVRIRPPRDSEVRHDPPGSCVDQCKDLLARVGIGSFGDRKVGDPGVKRGVNPAIVKVVFRDLDRRSSSGSLRDERIEGLDAVFRDLDLLVALVQGCFTLLVPRERRFQAGFRQNGAPVRSSSLPHRRSLLELIPLFQGCDAGMRSQSTIGRPDVAYERRCNSLRDSGKILQIWLRFDPFRPDLKSICGINGPGGNAQ